jgi:uncharacterized membrane protein YbhN (UPF0104 family)
MQPSRKSLLWARLACVLVTVAAVWLVLQRLDLPAVGQAFRMMRPGWFFAAIALYGLLFLPAAWRWHLVLRLTGQAVHPTATVRVSIIGHFFYTVLFGGIGGDTAKAALYARWYRRSLAEVLASAPLDRLLGFVGLLLLALLLGLAAGVSGAFGGLGAMSFKSPSRWIFGVVVVVVLIGFLLKRFKPSSLWGKFSRALMAGGRLLMTSPRVAISGVLCGLLVQLALNGVLALNLQAVSHAPVPWGRLLWTLPVIALVSGLPITFAGLGTREGAALVLLGLYGIPQSVAVAASLLTLTTALTWAAIGGLLWWREGRRQAVVWPNAETISVIIPTLNAASCLRETVARARAVSEVCEMIVSDAGSVDGTCELATSLGCTVVQGPPGHGAQMRLGAAQARGHVVLLLHADTWLCPEAGKAILDCLRDVWVVGGGFWRTFRAANQEGNMASRFAQTPSQPAESYWAPVSSKLKCAIRLYLGGRLSEGQAVFIRREVIERMDALSEGESKAEFELCRQLRRVGRLALADATITTSAVPQAQGRSQGSTDLVANPPLLEGPGRRA